MAVASFIAERDGPVVPPTPLADPGPHRSNGLALSLWTYLLQDARPAAPDPQDHRGPRDAAAGRSTVVLHGDAHAGNLLRGEFGWLWTDLEETCRGPQEWDLAVLARHSAVAAGAALAAYARAAGIQPPDPAELAVLAAGTLVLEMERQAPDVTTILASVGGLLSGIATASDGRLRVVGAEPDGAPTLTAALGAGEPVDAATGSVAVDSLAPRRAGS